MSELFRKKSMEKVTSPEQLNDYIKVTNPGVWMILAAVTILLVGVCVWGIFGHLDSQIQTAGVCKNGVLTCYIKEADISDVDQTALISVNGNEYSIAEISAFPIQLDEETESYVMHIGNIDTNEWVFEIIADTQDLPDGSYEICVITERVSPMSFVFN